MKKVHLVILSLVAVFLVAGCSSNEKAGGNTKEVEIQSDKALKVNWKKVTPIIEKDTGLNIKLIDTADITAYTTNIKQSLSSNTPPDVFTWWTGTQLADLVENDLVADITDEWPDLVKLGISDDLKEAMTFDGKIYGAPLNVIYNGVIYNKAIYDELGLSEPTTLDEFMDNCQKIKDAGITPIGIGGTWQSFVWPMVLMGSLDPELYDQWTSGEVGFDDARVKKVFYYWEEMIEKGYFSEQQQDQGKDLAMKEVAMALNANNWSQGLVEDYGMTLGKDVDIFVLPGVKKEDKKTIFYEISPFVISKKGDKEQALNVIKSYYSKDAQKEFAEKTGGSAITDIEIDNVITNKMLEVAGDSENYTLKLRYYEQFTPEIVNQSIDEYWKIAANPTEKQVDDSLKTIQESWVKVK